MGAHGGPWEAHGAPWARGSAATAASGAQGPRFSHALGPFEAQGPAQCSGAVSRSGWARFHLKRVVLDPHHGLLVLSGVIFVPMVCVCVSVCVCECVCVCA